MSLSTVPDESQLQRALSLLDKRQAQHPSTNDPDLETQFYNAVLECLLLDTADHWWCSHDILPLARESLWLFSLPDHDHIIQYKHKLNDLLQRCPKCIQSYYVSKQEMRKTYLKTFSLENVNHFFNILDSFDKSRLFTSLESSQTTPLNEKLVCAITELVCCPSLITHVDSQLCASFDRIQAAGRFPTLQSDMAQGVSLLVFHHHRVIRLWARKLLERFATEDTSTFDGDNQITKDLTTVASKVFEQFCKGPQDDGSNRIFQLILSKTNSNNNNNNNNDEEDQQYSIQTTQELVDIWKGLRLILNLLPTSPALTSLTKNIPMLTVLQHQLINTTYTSIALPEMLKTMNLLWTRLEYRFWTNLVENGPAARASTTGTTFYNLLKRVCDHPGFRNATKIAQEDTDNILTRDGTAYPQDKLIQRMQIMVDWIFPFWCSLRPFEQEMGLDMDFITGRILDTLLGYFQLKSWSLLFKTCTAHLAFQIVQLCITDNNGIPTAKLNEYAPQWISFALMVPTSTQESKTTTNANVPPLLEHVPMMARSILTDLLCQDSRILRDTFITLARQSSSSSSVSSDSSLPSTISEGYQQCMIASSCQSIWDTLALKPTKCLVTIMPTLLASMAPLVSFINIQRPAGMTTTSSEPLLDHIQALRKMITLCLDHLASDTLSRNIYGKTIVLDAGLVESLLSLLTCSDAMIRHSTNKFMLTMGTTANTQQQTNLILPSLQPLFVHHSPPVIIEAMTAILKDFMDLNNARIDRYNAVVPLVDVLAYMTQFLVEDEDGYLLQLVMMMATTTNTLGDDHEKEQQVVKDFWNAAWQVSSTVFNSSLEWASKHKPKEILDRVMPWMDIATQLAGSRPMFQKVVCNDSLDVDTLISSVDGLSAWIYVTRTSVLAKLVPLLDIILRQLQQLQIKISIDAYDRLMSAATGVNATRLEPHEKENIFFALSAHEPNNVIFLDDSDDDTQLEWQTLPGVTNNETAATTTFTSLSPPSTTTTTTTAGTTVRSATSSPSPSRSSVPSPPPPSSSSSSSSIRQSFNTTTKSSLSTSRPRQATLSETFKNTTAPSPESNTSRTRHGYRPNTKITTFFGNDTNNKINSNDNKSFSSDEEDFGEDIDMSNLPDDILDGTNSSKVSSSVSFGSNKVQSKSNDRHIIPHGATSTAAAAPTPALSTLASKPASRVFPNAVPKSETYAVTSTGRKLKAPTMGYSRMQQLRDGSRNDQRLGSTTKSPSAIAMERHRRGLAPDNDDDSSDDENEDDDGDEAGLLGLVHDIDEKREGTPQRIGNMVITQQEQEVPSSSLQALFDTDQPRRSVKLIDIPGSSRHFIQQRSQAKQVEQERKRKMMPDIDCLYKSILSWSLENISSSTETPPNTSLETFNHVQDTYATYKDYFEIFEPLLLLEVWSQMLRAKEMLSVNDVMDRFVMSTRCHVDDFVDVIFQVPLSVNTSSLGADDLVCMANHFGSDFFNKTTTEKHQQWHGKAFLGKVMAVSQRKNLGDITIRCFFTPDRIGILNSLSPKSSWRCLKITSLTTVQREYAALQGLQYYELVKDILHPHPTPMPSLPPQAVKDCIAKYGVNQPQAEAIIGALRKKKGFTLIQGPPGTGKTKTILGLVVTLLDQQQKQKKHSPGTTSGKILVCAPSNAAVDEIAKRLKDGIVTADGLVKPNVIRIGVADAVNASVKDLVLDRLIEKELAPTMAEENGIDYSGGVNNMRMYQARREKAQEIMKTLQLDIEQVDRDLASTTDLRLTADLRAKRKQLFQQKDRQRVIFKDILEDQRDHVRNLDASRLRARQKVFAECDIVCATLSGSGHTILSEMGLTFSTVIVDEAAQAVESSALIPLKYDCQRCILVGDPNQLPPTVISLLASKFSYQQSLFVRLEKNAPDNVYLLSIQYRMHPNISAFPSALFYQSRLLDGPKMAENTAAVWHTNPSFPPYLFLNVKEGQEMQGYGSSFYNLLEADAAVALVDKLANSFPTLKLAYKIGVITPYKQQVSQLKSRFERRFGSKILEVIDFNTVDGFQGQEKEIIIFSCVRANAGGAHGGYGGAIGFLSDIRRMNVGLTRAKRSLFILGHAQSLKGDQYWGNLVEDAKERKLFQDVT
ncbi:uncharacterized protein BX664DRAFT_56457 [Halteromyces radiatus]|uniref:uncharacterized protein n=1 Tax=Halteromyces radiatus TaxID=101107 RepID=UPI00221F14EF|nr:uncharacterized protein BX664DRAFT_56457 [Halteromyces radiatus]KAI8096315.1 hypothetical protein BX664DRAFT_56457 [Halteromyces radiatus]